VRRLRREVGRRVLNEQRVAHVTHPGRSTVGSGRNRFDQAVRAENFSAVPAVVLPLVAEAVLAAVALVDVVLVLPPDLKNDRFEIFRERFSFGPGSEPRIFKLIFSHFYRWVTEAPNNWRKFCNELIFTLSSPLSIFLFVSVCPSVRPSLYLTWLLWNEWRNISELREYQLNDLEKSCRWDYVRNETFSISWKEEMFYYETIGDGITSCYEMFIACCGYKSHSLGTIKDQLYDVKIWINYFSILQSFSFLTTLCFYFRVFVISQCL